MQMVYLASCRCTCHCQPAAVCFHLCLCCTGTMQMVYFSTWLHADVPATVCSHLCGCCTGTMQMVYLASCRCTCRCVFTPLSVLCRDHADGILGFMQIHLPTCRCMLHLCFNLPLSVFTFVCAVRRPCRWYTWLHADPPADLPLYVTPLSQPAAECLHLCLCCAGAMQMVMTAVFGFIQMYLPLGFYTPVDREGKPPNFWRNMLLVGTMRWGVITQTCSHMMGSTLWLIP